MLLGLPKWLSAIQVHLHLDLKHTHFISFQHVNRQELLDKYSFRIFQNVNINNDYSVLCGWILKFDYFIFLTQNGYFEWTQGFHFLLKTKFEAEEKLFKRLFLVKWENELNFTASQGLQLSSCFYHFLAMFLLYFLAMAFFFYFVLNDLLV